MSDGAQKIRELMAKLKKAGLDNALGDALGVRRTNRKRGGALAKSPNHPPPREGRRQCATPDCREVLSDGALMAGADRCHSCMLDVVKRTGRTNGGPDR